MNIQQLKNALIPELNNKVNGLIIEANQTGDKPDTPHATFNITTPYVKGAGRADERGVSGSTYQLERIETYQVTISFTAYAMDEGDSLNLAQELHDWFQFDGYDFLNNNNIVVVNKDNIQNRDAFLVNDYERRNGFDVILRITRTLTKDSEFIENVEGITE